MKSRITRNDLAIVAASAAVVAAAGFLAPRISRDYAPIPFAMICIAVIVLVILEAMRRTSEQLAKIRSDAFDDYRQVESLLGLYATLKPEKPLPTFRDHSASPDILRVAVSTMLQRKPRLTVELGSGSSTIVLAYCAKQVGGKVVSIDHEADFASRTREMLEERGLSDCATVTHRPIEPVQIRNREYLWYSTDELQFDAAIDFLFIDGPPYHIDALARYPAIPLLLPKLSQDAVILLDDANRPEEQRIAELWRKEYPELSLALLETEKGALLISRLAGATDSPARKV